MQTPNGISVSQRDYSIIGNWLQNETNIPRASVEYLLERKNKQQKTDIRIQKRFKESGIDGDQIHIINRILAIKPKDRTPVQNELLQIICGLPKDSSKAPPEEVVRAVAVPNCLELYNAYCAVQDEFVDDQQSDIDNLDKINSVYAEEYPESVEKPLSPRSELETSPTRFVKAKSSPSRMVLTPRTPPLSPKRASDTPSSSPRRNSGHGSISLGISPMRYRRSKSFK